MPVFTQAFSLVAGESNEGSFVSSVGPVIFASVTPGVASNSVDTWAINAAGHLTQNGVEHTADTNNVTAIYYHNHFLFQTAGGLWWFWTGGTTGNGQGWTPQPVPINITMNSTTFVGTPPINYPIGIVSVVAQDESGTVPFAGSLSILGVDSAFFVLNGPQLQFAQAGTAGRTSYSINLVATQNGVPFPPLTVPITITQAPIAALNLTTPPPFIKNVKGNVSPLGTTTVAYDDFTSWTESSTTQTATTSTMTWSVGADQDGNYGYAYIGGTTASQQIWLSQAAYGLTPYIFQATGPQGETGVLNIQAWVPLAAEKTTVTGKAAWTGVVAPAYNSTAYTFGQPGAGQPNNALLGTNWIQIYTGALHQNSNQTWGQGYYELNVWLPKGIAATTSKGFWSAFYLQNDGEIDIMEQWGERNQFMNPGIVDNNTGTAYALPTSNSGIDLTAGFHTLGCLWHPNYVAIYLDGTLQGSVTRPPGYPGTILNNAVMNVNIYQQFGALIDSVNYNTAFPPTDGWAIPSQFTTSRTTIGNTSMRIDWFRVSRLA